MASYSVNLPLQLQEEVEKCALDQGIPPDQFILWAVAEKVAVLQHQFHDRPGSFFSQTWDYQN